MLDQAVVFDHSGNAVPKTVYMIPDQKIADYKFSAHRHFGDRNIVLCHNAGWRNYFHWLTQAMWTMHLYAPHTTERDVFVFPSPLMNRQAMIELTGLPSDQIHFLHKGATLRAQSVTAIDSCYGEYTFAPSPLLADFGQSILARTAAAQSGARHIFISRRDSPHRSMQNEAEVEEMLVARGFQSVTLSGLSLGQQAALFHGADTIVAAHGAGLSNVIFCRRGARVIELTPTSYMNQCFLKIGQTLGLNWELYGFPAAKAAKQQLINWRVDVDFLKQVL